MRNWLVFALMLASVPALAEPPFGTISVKDVKPGMTGYGLTVFEGTKPERFNVRVIGVLHKFVPMEDIILINSDDPRLKYSGGVAGMSGSPIFLEGKLAGAFAYGFQFAKDPIAGVTPIEYMINEVRRPRRGPDGMTGTARSDAPPGQQRADNDAVRRMLAEAAAAQEPWWRKLLPTAPRAPYG